MGSRATSDPEIMLNVLREVRRRGLELRRQPHLALVGRRRPGGAARHPARRARRVPRQQPDRRRDLAPARGSRAAGPAARPRPGDRPSLPGDAGRASTAGCPAAEARGLRIVRAMDLIDERQLPAAGGRSRSAPATVRTARRRPPAEASARRRWRSGPPPRRRGSGRGPCCSFPGTRPRDRCRRRRRRLPGRTCGRP